MLFKDPPRLHDAHNSNSRHAAIGTGTLGSFSSDHRRRHRAGIKDMSRTSHNKSNADWIFEDCCEEDAARTSRDQDEGSDIVA